MFFFFFTLFCVVCLIWISLCFSTVLLAAFCLCFLVYGLRGCMDVMSWYVLEKTHPPPCTSFRMIFYFNIKHWCRRDKHFWISTTKITFKAYQNPKKWRYRQKLFVGGKKHPKVKFLNFLMQILVATDDLNLHELLWNL